MSMIEQYMKRVKIAISSRSKEVKLTLVDAQVLSVEMANIIAAENKNLDKIVQLQDAIISLQNKQTSNKVEPSDINMDGGEF